MNKTQKMIVKCAVAALAAMLVYPPFQIEFRGIIHNLGYALIFEPPRWGNYTGTVNLGLLLLQWLGVIIVAGMLWWLAKDKP